MPPAGIAGRTGLTRGRLPLLLLLLLPTLALSCGIPLPPASLTATAVSGGASTQPAPSSDGASLASSLAPGSQTFEGRSASLVSAAPSPLATVANDLTTVTPAPASATPQPSATPSPAAGTPSPATSSTASASPTVTSTPAGTPTPTATPTPDTSGSDAVSIVNSVRSAGGRGTLRVDANLTAAANAFARLMAERDSFGHTGPDGSTPESRIRAAGYSGYFEGEALAAGQTSAQAAVNTWLASPPHAAIVYSSDATEVGIGHYYEPGDLYGHYWVLIVGSR